MKILGAIGLGFTIVIIKFLMPEVFHGMENTLVEFFSLLEGVLSKGQIALTAF